MDSTITDRALDLGVFELDNQLADGREVSEPMRYDTVKKTVIKQANWRRQETEPQLEEIAR